MCRCFIICISGCCNVRDGSPVPMSRLYGYAGKRSFNNCFAQMFHYLHIRMLRRRGRVSRPVILSSSIHNPAYPSRLGDACLACFAIRHIPPVSAKPANACAFAYPPFSAKPANACAFAYPPLLREACKRLRICKSPKQKGRTRRPFKSVARRYKPEYFSVSAQYLLRRIYF